MPSRSRAILKSYFETGDRPTEQHFIELIDSFPNLLDDQLTIDPSLNVGLGTVNPDARLHIEGNLMLQNGSAVHTFSADTTLSDDSDHVVPTQRATKAFVENLMVGSVAPFAMETPPAGWLECDGSALNREGEYERLFMRIGTAFGIGDGQDTFNIPDLRGQFIRGWAHGSANDPDRLSRIASGSGGATGDEVGSYQADQMQGHRHNFSGNSGGTSSVDVMRAISGAAHPANFPVPGIEHISQPHSHSFTPSGSIAAPVNDGYGTPRYGNETRVRNVNLMYCIKY